MKHHSLRSLGALTVVGTLALAGCSSGDPLSLSNQAETSSGEAVTLVVGSQDCYSNEIIAEIYAQALEDVGYRVQRDMRVGQREIYMPEIEAGQIDVFPEYTGNLLQYLDSDTTATSAEDVHESLTSALPGGLRVLDQADTSDQDSYVITKEFADEHGGITSVAELAGIDGIVLGGNSELKVRPYGPDGLAETYNVVVSFTPVEDSGGPLTVKALRDGSIQLADIYSADPVLAGGDLVVLEDPESLFLASHVVPVVSERVDDHAVEVLNAVNAKLSAEDLVAMNAQSVSEQTPAGEIARSWLAKTGLVRN